VDRSRVPFRLQGCQFLPLYLAVTKLVAHARHVLGIALVKRDSQRVTMPDQVWCNPYSACRGEFRR
jgi:hypothetical protein